MLYGFGEQGAGSRRQTHTLIDKLYEGSRQMFLASFLKSEKISAAELEEIRRMIEEEEK